METTMPILTDQPQRALADIEPIVVRPRIACRMLGGIGSEHLWQLINSGELESYLDGRARRITVASIKRHIARQLEAAKHAAAARPLPRVSRPTPAAQSRTTDAELVQTARRGPALRADKKIERERRHARRSRGEASKPVEVDHA
jgi:hypothetical protein